VAYTCDVKSSHGSMIMLLEFRTAASFDSHWYPYDSYEEVHLAKFVPVHQKRPALHVGMS